MTNAITGFILAAGLGTRMRPLTVNTPKPLIRFLNQPLIAHTINAFENAGVQNIVINTHYLADQIVAFANEYDGAADLIISDERDKLRDTGGGVSHARAQLKSPWVLIANGDNFVDVAISDDHPIAQLAFCLQNSTSDGVISLVPATGGFGHRGKGDYYIENGMPHRRLSSAQKVPFIYAGFALLRTSLFSQSHWPESFSLIEIFDALEKKQKLGFQLCRHDWYHLGDVEALQSAEDRLLKT